MRSELRSPRNGLVQWSISSLARFARRTRYLYAACLLGIPAWGQVVGTDICLPGQNGVMACPCNNPPVGGGKGCDNYGPGSAGVSASLSATGVASVTNGNDTLQFTAVNENDTVLTIFAQSAATFAPGVSYGAGVSCLSGTPLVLYFGNAGSGGTLGQITRPQTGVDPEVHAQSAALGDTLTAGQTRYYMAAYRDKDAAAAANCNNPLWTFNSTQGIAIVWGP